MEVSSGGGGGGSSASVRIQDNRTKPSLAKESQTEPFLVEENLAMEGNRLRRPFSSWLKLRGAAVRGRTVQETARPPRITSSGSSEQGGGSYSKFYSLFSDEPHLIQAAWLFFSLCDPMCRPDPLSDYNNPPQADFLQHVPSRGGVGSVVLVRG